MDRSHTITQADGAVEVEYLDVSWSTLRRERDAALAESDWRALKDVVLSTAWKEYRQALRELPQNFESANDAVDSWPTPPE
jgi:hypothetical protein